MQSNSYWITASQAADRRWVDTLGAISQAVNEGADERTVGDMIARASTLLTGVDRAAVAVSDLEGEGLRLVGAHGLTADYVEHLSSDRPMHFAHGDEESTGPSIRGFRSGRTVAVHDITTDPAFEPWRQLAKTEGFRSLLAVPLVASGTRLGVLTCYCDDPGQIERSQSDLIESLATHAGIVLESFQLRRHRERTIDELKAALSELLRDRTLHNELMELTLRGASQAEILDVAGSVLSVSLSVTDAAGDPDATVPFQVTDGPAWLVANRQLASAERLALESVGLVVALEEQRRISVFEAEARTKLDLLSAILSLTPEADTRELLERCRRHGYELDRPYQVMVLASDSGAAGSGRRLARLAEHLAPTTRPHCLTSYRQEVAVVLLPAADAYGDYPAVLHAAAQRELGSDSCSAVLGATCASLDDYGPAFRTALATLQLRQRAGTSGSLVTFENLGALQFLLQGAPGELIAFSRRLLTPLTDGNARSSDALVTLQSYLANKQRAGATARALHVHPNTITNRLERIGQLTGGSLDDAEHLLNLKLALLVHDVIATGRS